MLVTIGDVVPTVRKLLNDVRSGRRLGQNWTDAEIYSCFTRHYYEIVHALVRSGLCHTVASMLRVTVAGDDTANYDITGPSGPVIILPPDFGYMVSAGIEGRNVPVYHLTDFDESAVGGPSFPEELRAFGLYIYYSGIRGNYVAMPMFDYGHHALPRGKYLIMVYVHNEYQLGTLTSEQQLVPWWLYQHVLSNTVAELMEYDAGYEMSPILSVLRTVYKERAQWYSALNGSLRNIPSVQSR